MFPDGLGDVPDKDHAARLVILNPDQTHYGRGEDTPAIEGAEEILDQRQGGPWINRNLLVFLAPDAARVGERLTSARRRSQDEHPADEVGSLYQRAEDSTGLRIESVQAEKTDLERCRKGTRKGTSRGSESPETPM